MSSDKQTASTPTDLAQVLDAIKALGGQTSTLQEAVVKLDEKTTTLQDSVVRLDDTVVQLDTKAESLTDTVDTLLHGQTTASLDRKDARTIMNRMSKDVVGLTSQMASVKLETGKLKQAQSLLAKDTGKTETKT